MTFVLGLTGSVGMGKSATASIFRKCGVPIHDADATVHELYRGEAAPLIAQAFPSVVKDGVVDRAALGQLVLEDPDKLRALEAIVHPLVRAAEKKFLADLYSDREPLAVLDIPLLFETGGEERCDAVLVVTTSPEIQRERVLLRPGMTEKKFQSLLAKQMPDAEKRRRAHFRVDTGNGFASAEAQVRSILTCLAARPGRVLQRMIRRDGHRFSERSSDITRT
ncbi:dephospho-CoA kinase [Microvirga sp. 2MCAF38]|uniref:dephospho-CoA kinase n=1 Tax=Microvirga sp. 2MCAF38 TaxID=3232989 RepID=UPI003F96BAB1